MYIIPILLTRSSMFGISLCSCAQRGRHAVLLIGQRHHADVSQIKRLASVAEAGCNLAVAVVHSLTQTEVWDCAH